MFISIANVIVNIGEIESVELVNDQYSVFIIMKSGRIHRIPVDNKREKIFLKKANKLMDKIFEKLYEN